jgi:hypothetical protein
MEGIREMLHRYGVRNQVVVLSDDPTQMQKTVNEAMALVKQSSFLKTALINLKPELSV